MKFLLSSLVLLGVQNSDLGYGRRRIISIDHLVLHQSTTCNTIGLRYYITKIFWACLTPVLGLNLTEEKWTCRDFPSRPKEWTIILKRSKLWRGTLFCLTAQYELHWSLYIWWWGRIVEDLNLIRLNDRPMLHS